MATTLATDGDGRIKRTIFERSATTQWLIDELVKHKDSNEVVPYEVLNEACGLDVQKNRNYLASAIACIEREHGVKFGAERCVGVRRLDIDGVLDSGDFQVRKIRNISKKTKRTLENCLADKELNQQQKTRLFTVKSISGLFESLTKRSKIKEIEGIVEQKQVEVNFGEIMNSLKKK